MVTPEPPANEAVGRRPASIPNRLAPADITRIEATTRDTQRVPMDALRKTALIAGVLYLLTFVSIPTLALYGPVHDQNYILGPGPDTAVIVGGVLEMIVALACIG